MKKLAQASIFLFLLGPLGVLGGITLESPITRTFSMQDNPTIRSETALVVVPLIVRDRRDVGIPDMRADEFILYEDGVRQTISFFAPTPESFSVVLMLDTSASTREKLTPIQQAAFSFIQQLQDTDRVKIISFAESVEDHGSFTSDRLVLKRTIEGLHVGSGTKLYDAVQLALVALETIKGRKAIVLFTDGVDWHSFDASAAQNLEKIEESGVIIYPVRYDTRADTERVIREQSRRATPDVVSIVLGGPRRDPTPPTFPGGTSPTTGGLPPLLPPPIILPYPSPSSIPPQTRYPGADRYPSDPYPLPTSVPPASSPSRSSDPMSTVLDESYRIADEYLNDLAERSGGKLHRADTLPLLPAAFRRIAEELRTQYSLGYYPTNSARDGKYRKIVVKTTRKGATLRSRPGYRVPRGPTLAGAWKNRNNWPIIHTLPIVRAGVRPQKSKFRLERWCRILAHSYGFEKPGICTTRDPSGGQMSGRLGADLDRICGLSFLSIPTAATSCRYRNEGHSAGKSAHSK